MPRLKSSPRPNTETLANPPNQQICARFTLSNAALREFPQAPRASQSKRQETFPRRHFFPSLNQRKRAQSKKSKRPQRLKKPLQKAPHNIKAPNLKKPLPKAPLKRKARHQKNPAQTEIQLGRMPIIQSSKHPLGKSRRKIPLLKERKAKRKNNQIK